MTKEGQTCRTGREEPLFRALLSLSYKGAKTLTKITDPHKRILLELQQTHYPAVMHTRRDVGNE